MAVGIPRRQFICALGGAAVAWPRVARTQQPAGIKRVGVLMGTADSDPDQKALVSVFSRALAEFRLDGRHKHSHRISLGGRRHFPFTSSFGGARAPHPRRHPWAGHACYDGVAAGSADNSSCVCERFSPGQYWPCLKPRPSGRQHYGLHQLRFLDGGQMAGNSERDFS